MIRVDVMGGLRVSDETRVLEELARRPMRAALLILLAVEHALARERVLEILWPDRDSERGRHALNQTVYELRRTLGADCISVSGETIAIGGQVRCDAVTFEEAIARADRASALELYRGPFLDGFFLAPTNEFEDWLTRTRSRLRRRARRARLELIDELRASGDLLTALKHAAQGADDDPLDDDFHHQLLTLLVDSGQRALALDRFEQFRLRLAAQGLTPLDETRQLIARIQAESIEVDPPAGAAVDPPAAPAAEASPGQGTCVEPTPMPTTPGADAAPGSAATVDDTGTPPPDPDASSAGSGSRRRNRSLVAASPALWRRSAVAVAVGVVMLLIWFRPHSGRVTPAPDPLELTVIQLTDHSPNSQYQYLARGLTEALVHSLQQRVPLIRVIALDTLPRPDSTRPGPETKEDTAQAVRSRLRGGITVGQDSIRVGLLLTDPTNDAVIRTIEVRAPWRSELALIDSIVPELLLQMQPELGQRLLRRDLRAGTRNPRAFSLYLRALEKYEILRRLEGINDPGAEERIMADAEALLVQADRLDPDWSRIPALRARVARGRALNAMRFEGGGLERSRALLDTALVHADEAVSRSPNDAYSLATRARVRLLETAFAAGDQARVASITSAIEQDVHRAVSLDPTAAEAWLILSNLEYMAGEFASSYAAARQAYQTDSYLRSEQETIQQLAMSAFELGRDSEAAHWCYRGVNRFPQSSLFLMCRSYLFAYHEPPQLDSSLALIWEAMWVPRSAGIPMIAELSAARALARAGMRDSARSLVDQTRARGHGPTDGSAYEAAVFAALGQTDTAIALVQAAYRRAPHARNLFASRILAPLRSDPRFPRLPHP